MKWILPLALSLSGVATAAPFKTLAPELVWPSGVPPLQDWPGQATKPVSEEITGGGETIRNVIIPTYQAYLPSASKAQGTAVIIAPGGGFRLLSIQKDGTQVARWLAEHGIAAFVLKYRLVQQSPGESDEALRQRVMTQMRPDQAGEPAVADGQQALRLIRARAARYGVDPNRIGVIGFSAGGHVAGMMALAPDVAERPAFVGLIYGMPFASTPPPLPPANLSFAPGTPREPWLQPKPTPAPGALPPLFMAMAQDDLAVGGGFRAFYDALFAVGYRPELHLYAWGNHGFGMKRQGASSDHWIANFAAWLSAMGFTGHPPAGR